MLGRGGSWVNGGGGGFTSPMTTLGDILYEDVTPTAARLAGNITTTRKFLRQVGSGATSNPPAWDILLWGDVPDFDPSASMLALRDDFDGGPREASTAHIMGRFGWATQAQNAGTFSSAGAVVTSSVNHPGVLEIGSGANANDACTIYQGLQGGSQVAKVFVLGSGAIRLRKLVNIPTLSDGTDNFTVVFGLADQPDWNSPQNAVRIMYQYATSNTKWQMSTMKAASETKTAGSGSTSTVVTGWTWLQIDIDAAGANATFSVGPTLATLVSIGTQSTNMPVLGMPVRADFRKTLGTTARKIGIDYIDAIMALSR